MNVEDHTMKYFFVMMRSSLFVMMALLVSQVVYAQQWGDEGELDDVEIDIVKERQITLPKANRNFEKIPPRPSESTRPTFQYDFRPFSFQTPQINAAIRPLKLKQENPSNVYGGYLSAGYGNYASPYLEGFINSKRDKNKLVGAHAYLRNSGKGPVDDKNSGSGASGVSLYGKAFSEYLSLAGELEYESRYTHFYGYPTGTDVSEKDIKQAYNVFKLSGELSNAKNSAFSYQLGGAFSYLMDKYKARETQVDIDFNSAYEVNDESSIGIKAGYTVISRKDEAVEAKPRSLFTVNPSYVFYPVEDLKLSAGIIAAFENDSIDKKDVHAYPDLRASYPLSPSVDVVAALTGGIEKVSLQSLSRENLWLAPNVPVFHTNKVLDFQVALNTRIGNKVAVNGGLSFASLKNWYFYENTEADQSKFTPAYDKGATKRTNFFASLGFTQTETAKFLLRGDVYSYSTDEVEEAWHRPTYKVTGDVSFNIVKKLLIGVNLIAQGGMKAKSYTSVPGEFEVVKLDAALDLNARTEYVVSDSFSVFIQCNNITSNQYPVFLNYPVRGFQVLGGLTWSF
ncbi:hypothetical protein KK083_24690 [Fulvivirgaceae bacterium PWU4]|uniref:TonB-dependent receptor n=1 Tax=Chryseosolibacter histidini TaxID=2782349 RepID=A0AAP2DT77_9BACT|nr:hypothetical protein [Chryseosolibacter histidini]MBT1700109.1 hypothetical protein [Chryseosolibacter histidini]